MHHRSGLPAGPPAAPSACSPAATAMVGVTRTPATVAVPRTAPRTSTGSRRRSVPWSAVMPARIPTNATTATGAFATSRTCHGATARTSPPTVGPTASPTRPAVEITVRARTRRSSASNRRNARAIAPGVVIAAATPVSARTTTSPSTEVTARVATLTPASRTSPTSMTRRRPNRSATAPNRSIRPPNASEYAPETHCSADVDAPRSRPMVGRATVRTELSSISNRNTADSPARATQASRRRCGDPGRVIGTDTGALLRRRSGDSHESRTRCRRSGPEAFSLWRRR